MLILIIIFYLVKMKFTLMIVAVFVLAIMNSECVFHLKQINQGNIVMSNSNSNNAGNGNEYSKTAEIVNPHVDFIHTRKVDVIKVFPFSSLSSFSASSKIL